MKNLIPTFEEFINEAYKTVWLVFDNDKSNKSNKQIEGIFSSDLIAKKTEKKLLKSKQEEIKETNIKKVDDYFVLTVIWNESNNYFEIPIKIVNTEKEAIEFRNDNNKKYKDLQFGEFEVDEN